MAVADPGFDTAVSPERIWTRFGRRSVSLMALPAHQQPIPVIRSQLISLMAILCKLQTSLILEDVDRVNAFVPIRQLRTCNTLN